MSNTLTMNSNKRLQRVSAPPYTKIRRKRKIWVSKGTPCCTRSQHYPFGLALLGGPSGASPKKDNPLYWKPSALCPSNCIFKPQNPSLKSGAKNRPIHVLLKLKCGFFEAERITLITPAPYMFVFLKFSVLCGTSPTQEKMIFHDTGLLKLLWGVRCVWQRLSADCGTAKLAPAGPLKVPGLLPFGV